MSFKNFEIELGKGLKAHAYFLYGEDSWLLKRAAHAVRDTVPEAERDFMFHSFDAESADSDIPVEQLIDILNTVPFFGGRKAVVIEGAQKLNVDETRALGRYIAKPSPSAVLIILHRGAIKKTALDDKIRKFGPLEKKGKDADKDAKTREIHEAIAKNLKIIPLDIRDVGGWLRDEAARRGFSLTESAAGFLMATVGSETGLLSSELDKLAHLGKKKLDHADVAAICSGNGDYTAFDLTKALAENNAVEVFRIYGVLSRTEEPYALLGALNWHYEKAALQPDEKARVFSLLHEADFLVKSAGGAYPMEHLFAKLMRS